MLKMNKRELENMRFIMSLGKEQFALWYMKRDEDEKSYIDELLIRYTIMLAKVEAQLDEAELNFESVGEDERDIEVDLSDAKSVLDKIMAL
jgi:hypothetical protein